MDTPTKAEVLKLLKLIKPNLGSARRLNRKPELKFIEAFKKYVNSKKFLGNASVAIESLGLNRNYVRGIIQRTLGNENRNTGKIFQGTTMQTTVPVPKNAIPFKEPQPNAKLSSKPWNGMLFSVSLICLKYWLPFSSISCWAAR